MQIGVLGPFEVRTDDGVLADVTLRAVVDWSWELLTEAERMVLRRLAVFSGGASLDAAERVCVGDGVEQEQVLELLTALAESDLARHAHLAYFTGLTETAEPHLRRAEQLEWLATLEAEHENIAAAMRGALAAGEAQAAMRLAAAVGWYWWLGGHRAEGTELITAATNTPGEVADEVRAMVYAFVVMFLTSGRGDEHQVAEWIHEAHRLSQRSQHRNPLLGLIAPLERMLQAPDAFLPAWESVLDNEDPWVRALARLQLGKMRNMLGEGGRDADEYLETALAEFRVIGERWGISFALTELAERIAVRGEFAAACEYYEQAVAVVTEVGAIEEVIRMQSRQAELYCLLGDEDSSAAAIAEAERCAERVTWPDALAELALSKAELARWGGNAEEAHQQLGVADLALRRDEHEQAARLLAASAAVRGLPDRSNPDTARIEQAARRRLGEARFAQATQQGAQASWRELVEATPAC